MLIIGSHHIQRFGELFTGNRRSFLQHKNGTTYSIKKSYTIDDVEKHLVGEVGLGVGPILDSNDCFWGCIDIDCHGEDQPEIDLIALEKSIKENRLPLVVCRSKSGGAHLFVFALEAVRAKALRIALTSWAQMLGFAGSEIFPKQEILSKDRDGELQFASALNLPYFNAHETNRYCVEGGKPIDFAHFLDLAESMRVSASAIVEKSETNHAEAPPCIQNMIAHGVGHGHRNLGLFSICVYLKQAFPETWKDKAFDVNAKSFSTPIPHTEAKKVIDSVARREYRYKCKEEPCRSRCNSSVCVEKKFGITTEERGEIEFGDMPVFSEVKKFNTDPVKWSIKVDGKEIVMSTSTIMDFRLVRMAIAENLTKLVPPMKNDQWSRILAPLMIVAESVDAPQDASNYGVVLTRLREFLQKADLTSTGEDITKRNAILRGSPVLQLKDGERTIFFRGTDFKEYLKKTRSDELKGVDLWMHLKDHGVEHGKLRIGKNLHHVWMVKATDDMMPETRNMEVVHEF